jgi:hypothetical protein
MAKDAAPQMPARISLWLKVPYTLFVAVLVPFYFVQYGPLNFLWFCDVALLVTLAALWLESPLLASMQAVAIAVPQLLWVLDFFVRLFTGGHIIDMTEYMFDSGIPLYTRGLSLFHAWLPILLLWLVWRLGYDRRAWWAQTLLGWTVLLLCYLLVPEINNRAGNVNKIFGPDDQAPQTWMPQFVWLGVLMLAYPAVVYIPTHFLLRFLAPARDGHGVVPSA